MVFLFRPEHVRYLLIEQPRKFRNSQLASDDDPTSANQGLLTIDGEKHRQQRRAVQPAFHRKKVESYVPIIVQYTQDMLKNWQMGDVIDLTHEMQEITMRIVCKCLFDIDFTSQLKAIGETFDDMIGNPAGALETVLNIHVDNPVTSYGKRMSAMRKINMLIYTLLAQRRIDTGEHNDVLSMLLEAEDGVEPGQTLSDKQIHDHILTFIAAGHETTALALTWTFFLLSKNPAIRAKLEDELQSVLGGRTPTLEDLPRLQYTDWVLNESLRLYPPAWLQIRIAAEDVELGGVQFAKGTTFVVSQWVMHRLPEFWEQPKEFRPERWDPVNSEKIVPGAYFPFGGGPRMCIGMPFAQLEAKLMLATILQQFQPQVPANYDPGCLPVITLRPRHKLRAKLLPPSITQPSATWAQRIATPDLQELAERRGCRSALLDIFGLLRL
jgi:cytochrome P450